MKIEDIVQSATGKVMEKDQRVRRYVMPVRILWQSSGDEAFIDHAETLLEQRSGQITLSANRPCVFNSKSQSAGILLDFGIEMQGGIQILTWNCGPQGARLRVRFGESAMEAMSELGGESNATNDHAVRDQEIAVSNLGMAEIGNTGFRFVRIDLPEQDSRVEIKSVRAVFIYQDLEYKGSFSCSDPLLNQIWQTGAYTVHLNMQNYVWDGIKRDRLVWIGDMHPETSTIQTVFGYDESVPRSLDMIRDETPLPGWMNHIPSYSLWWILIHWDWFRQNGDLHYLAKQKTYLLQLLDSLIACIDEEGKNTFPMQFLDWPSSEDKPACAAGVHALFVLAMQAGVKICRLLGAADKAAAYEPWLIRLESYKPDPGQNKQAAALLVLAGLSDPETANQQVLARDGSRNLSTFLGYYVLQARARAGDIQGSLDCIRAYWGGMIKLGATTFWEDFNLDWTENAGRIDQLVPDNQVDLHGTYGAYCYIGYRHSLCHGWASGPTAWLAEHVLGVKIVDPGCRTVKIDPQLGDLQWVKGSYPTPFGLISLEHRVNSEGKLETIIDAPAEIKIIR